MLVPMTQVEILGLRNHLDAVLATVQQVRLAEVVTADDPDDRAAPACEDEPPAGLDRVLAVAPAAVTDTAPLADADLDRLLDELAPPLDALLAQREALRSELETLPRYLEPLVGLLPLVPELAELDERDLAALRLTTVALVLDDPDERIINELRRQLDDVVPGRFLLVVGPHSAGSVGCLLVLGTPDLATVQTLLGADHISRLELPDEYAGRSLRSAVQEMRTRVATLPGRLAARDTELAALVAPHAARLWATRRALTARRERHHAARHADLGPRTFALRLWVPRPHLRRLPNPVVVAEVRPRRPADTPVPLANRPRVLPFQRLVGFLSWPRHGGIDPTGLMAVALPFLFGVMVGDVVYGLALVGIGTWLRRRARDNAAVADLARVLSAGGWWATAFGVLFGEALGSLGNTLGMPALWFCRGGPDALAPLLLFALAVGAVHIVLGVLLGLWTALRHRHRRHAAERGGMLLALAGLFALAGVATAALPDRLLTPAVSAVVIGLVLVTASQGLLGVLLGPLELLGTIGNVLSYLRLAAVGLASVYLANVANELAANAPLLLGVLVAAFVHALNLALAAFSPMVQALRLHYVEFFSKFHDGGGRAFTPLGAALDDPAPAPPAPSPSPTVAAPHLPTPRRPDPAPSGVSR